MTIPPPFCDPYDPLCIQSPPPIPPAPPAQIDIQHKNTLLPSFLIAAGALLALSFLLFLISFIVLRRRRSLRRQQQHHPPSNVDADGSEEEEVTHHIWLIRTVGLDETLISSIASFPYKTRGEGGDCAVCLGEFKDGETVKLLPKCAHEFHVSCIDTWLWSHVSCPVCRAAVTAGDDEEVKVEVEELGESSAAAVEVEGDEGFQPVRRSVSMDAVTAAEIELAVVGRKEKVIERSQSTRSGRFFFPRYARGRSASVLPV